MPGKLGQTGHLVDGLSGDLVALCIEPAQELVTGTGQSGPLADSAVDHTGGGNESAGG